MNFFRLLFNRERIRTFLELLVTGINLIINYLIKNGENGENEKIIDILEKVNQIAIKLGNTFFGMNLVGTSLMSAAESSKEDLDKMLEEYNEKLEKFEL